MHTLNAVASSFSSVEDDALCLFVLGCFVYEFTWTRELQTAVSVVVEETILNAKANISFLPTALLTTSRVTRQVMKTEMKSERG